MKKSHRLEIATVIDADLGAVDKTAPGASSEISKHVKALVRQSRELHQAPAAPNRWPWVFTDRLP